MLQHFDNFECMSVHKPGAVLLLVYVQCKSVFGYGVLKWRRSLFYASESGMSGGGYGTCVYCRACKLFLAHP